MKEFKGEKEMRDMATMTPAEVWGEVVGEGRTNRNIDRFLSFHVPGYTTRGPRPGMMAVEQAVNDYVLGLDGYTPVEQDIIVGKMWEYIYQDKVRGKPIR